jgi:hypothetical protein
MRCVGNGEGHTIPDPLNRVDITTPAATDVEDANEEKDRGDGDGDRNDDAQALRRMEDEGLRIGAIGLGIPNSSSEKVFGRRLKVSSSESVVGSRFFLVLFRLRT